MEHEESSESPMMAIKQQRTNFSMLRSSGGSSLRGSFTDIFGKLSRTLSTGFGRSNLKYINVEASVLESYHDSFLFGDVPCSVRLRIFFRGGALGYIWYLMEFTLAVLSGVLYVYSTYRTTQSDSWLTYTQHAISCAFVADYVLRIFSEPARLYYIFSLAGLIDLLSVLPIFSLFRSGGRRASDDIFHLIQFLRIVRISTCITKLGIAGSTLTQQIFLLVISTVGAVVIDAGVIQWVEYHAAPKDMKRRCSPKGCMTFWEAFYFVIVTMATVGYGDVVPQTIAGQAVIIITILAGIAVLPIQLSRISSLAYNRPYGGSYDSRKVLGSRFLILSGSLDLPVIQNFLAELYNPTHAEDLEIYPLHVIILAPFTPSFELQQVISSYNNQVDFYEGSPSQPTDLDRVCASKASAFFLLADREAVDARMEDQTQIFRALSVQRYCKGRVRIIVEFLDPETQTSAVWDNTQGQGIEHICQAKIHSKLLARSCAIRGLSTFITNLFTSEIQLQDVDPAHFMAEYNHSFDNEVYPLIFPSAFHDVLYEEIVEFIFTSFNVTLFALDVPVGGFQETRKVLLHPKGHIIHPDDLGIVMAGNLNTVYSISMFQGKVTRGYFSNWKLQQGQPSSVSTPLKVGIDLHLDGTQLPSSTTGHDKLCNSIKRAMQKACQDGTGDRSSELSQACSTSETVIENILGWPMPIKYGRPHPVVIERNAQKIMQNLDSRMLSIVALKKGHILVCCQGSWPPYLFYFLLELRKPAFPNPPVVILHPKEPAADQWSLVGVFKDVFFVKGSPIHEVDLLRAGVERADKVVVFAYPGVPLDASGRGVDSHNRKKPGGYTSDVDCIIILANIQRLLGGGDLSKVLVEMQHPVGLQYLCPHYDIPPRCISRDACTRHSDALAHFTPAYMEGRAISPGMLGFLVRSSFYNKNTVSIVEQLLVGGFVEGVDEHLRHLQQIRVPEKYANKAYGDMFLGLLAEQGMLALGLYRAKGTLGSLTPYVLTNPPKSCTVNAEDLVFVL